MERKVPGDDKGLAELTYDDWADLLCWAFFRPENARQPVTLFVSDDVLASIAGEQDPERAANSLLAAVRRHIGSEASNDLFSRVVLESDEWQRRGSPGSPPSLPLLAAAVLSATRMAREGRIAEHNYYVRFREVIGLPGVGQPAGYDWAFPFLWTQLDNWLEVTNGGRLGRSTIRTHPTFHYIGYALSQALFRASDRHRLGAFFSQLGFVPGSTVDVETLVQRFRVWARGPTGLSPGARRMAQDVAYEPTLRSILASAAEAWDGHEADEHGDRVERIGVFATFAAFAPPSLSFVASRPAGLGDAISVAFNGSSVALTSTVDAWYDECPVAVTEQALLETWRLVSDDVRWLYRGGPLVPLRLAANLGGWVSANFVTPTEEHRILVHSDLVPALVHYLSKNATPGWSPEEIPGLDTWRVYVDVVIRPGAPSPSDARLIALSAPLRIGVELHGGLQVATHPPTYIAGAAPDVWLPEGIPSDTVVLLDGQPLTVAEGARSVSLSEVGLDLGTHTLRVGPTALRFEVRVPPSVPEALVGRLGYCLRAEQPRVVRASRAECNGPHDFASGAVGWAAPGSRTAPPWWISLRPGASQAVVLGRVPGETHEIGSCAMPRWIRATDLTPVAIEIDVDFEPHVILQRSPIGWSLAVLSDRPPEDRYVVSNRLRVGQWAAWVLKATRVVRQRPTPASFAAYVDSARRITRASG